MKLEDLKVKACMIKANIEDFLSGRARAKTEEEIDQLIADAELEYWKEVAMKELQECQNLKFVRFVASFLDNSTASK